MALARLFSPYPQGVGDTVNVVEKRGNQRDLQDRGVVEANLLERIHVITPKRRRIFGEFLDIREHSSVFLIQISRAPVTLDSVY